MLFAQKKGRKCPIPHGLFGGWPGEGSPLASNTEMSGGQLLEGDSFYMWIDMYERKSLQGSSWSLRMGRSISALSMDEMPVGGDVLLQYDIAPGRESMSFRHFTLYSEESADWHVCTTGAPGKPSMAKTARCEGGQRGGLSVRMHPERPLLDHEADPVAELLLQGAKLLVKLLAVGTLEVGELDHSHGRIRRTDTRSLIQHEA